MTTTENTEAHGKEEKTEVTPDKQAVAQTGRNRAKKLLLFL